MSQTLENTLLLGAIFIVVTIFGVRYVQKQQKRKLIAGFILVSQNTPPSRSVVTREGMNANPIILPGLICRKEHPFPL